MWGRLDKHDFATRRLGRRKRLGRGACTFWCASVEKEEWVRLRRGAWYTHQLNILFFN